MITLVTLGGLEGIDDIDDVLFPQFDSAVLSLSDLSEECAMLKEIPMYDRYEASAAQVLASRDLLAARIVHLIRQTRWSSIAPVVLRLSRSSGRSRGGAQEAWSFRSIKTQQALASEGW